MENKKINKFLENKKGELDWRKFITSVIIMGLFVFAIFMMFSNFSRENNSMNVLSNSNFSSLNQSIFNKLNEAQAQTTNLSNSFNKEASGSPILTQFGFYFRSVIDAGTTFVAFAIEMPKLMLYSVANILGISPVVTGTFLGILTLSILLLIWALLRTGK